MSGRRFLVGSLIFLGFITLAYLQTYACESYFKVLSGQCSNPNSRQYIGSLLPITVFGIKGIDFFLCLIVPFFLDALNHPLGALVWVSLANLFTVALVQMAIESSRPQAIAKSLLLRIYPVWAALSQLLGVSVTFPAVFLASYFATSPSTMTQSPPSSKRIYAIGIGLLIHHSIGLAPLVLSNEGDLKNWVLVAFQFSPILACLLWLPFSTKMPSGKTSALRSRKAVKRVYSFFAIISLVLHVIVVVGFAHLVAFGNAKPLALEVFMRPPQDGNPVAALHFLWIDLIVLFGACLLFVASEDGLLTCLKVIGAGLVFSPGAAFADYLGNIREERIFKSASGKKASE